MDSLARDAGFKISLALETGIPSQLSYVALSDLCQNLDLKEDGKLEWMLRMRILPSIKSNESAAIQHAWPVEDLQLEFCGWHSIWFKIIGMTGTSRTVYWRIVDCQ
jgi:hypothetical protein